MYCVYWELNVFKKLTVEQDDLLKEINSNPNKNFVINGDAGTGKTVLLTHLVAMLLNEQPNKRIAVVLQPNWIKTAKSIFKVYGMNNSNLTIATSTKLINADENYDVVIVDESHKLLYSEIVMSMLILDFSKQNL